MADLTPGAVKSRFDEFAAVDDAVVQTLIDEAYRITDVNPDATLYCVAHLLALEEEHTGKPDGGSGVIMGESIGPRSVTYRTQAQTEREVFFATTSYGRRVLAIEARTPAAGFSFKVF